MRKASVKAEILLSTSEEKANHIVRLKIEDRWYEALKAFYRENKADTITWRITFESWEASASDAAKRLFHELRDRICEAMGDSCKEHKDHLKKVLKASFGVTLANGKLKSVGSYTVLELSRWIDGAFLMGYEANADLRDLEPERGEIK